MIKKSSTVGGFGLLQVMIGTVVLGIFAMVFVRKAYNRADISLITELTTYRDQVIDYYAAVVQSRTAWQCTRQCNKSNSSNLRDWTINRGGAGCTLGNPCSLAIYDGDGNCQSGCPSPLPTVKLLSQGWRFSVSDNNFVFTPPAQTGTAPTDRNHPFLVKATWEKASSSTNSVKVTVSIFFDPHEDWKKEHTALDIGDRHRVFYMNRTPYKNCADGLAKRFGRRFFDDGGRGTGVERYAGDTAVVAIDSITGLVECWDSPLVIPPCYEPSKPPFNGASTSLGVSFTAANPCTVTDQGLCPKIGQGTTGITHFDQRTGISHCGTEHILMVEHDGISGIDCGTNSSGGLVGISGSGNFVCSNDPGGGYGTGVSHNEGNEHTAGIRGWDSSGDVDEANDPIVAGKNKREEVTGIGSYWTGDQGDKGVKGTTIKCHNCCKYPKIRTDNWRQSRCCQERYEDCNDIRNANPSCRDCKTAEDACRNCQAEWERDCHWPCYRCNFDRDTCMATCWQCERQKRRCEEPCDKCKNNCDTSCRSCKSTYCDGRNLDSDDYSECVNSNCNSSCNNCRSDCENSDSCRSCGNCSSECSNRSTCSRNWDRNNCDTKCNNCIGSDRMSDGCKNYNSSDGKCHNATVLFPACGSNDTTPNSCKKCRKDKSDCESLHDALENARDTTITNNSSYHCVDVPP